MVRWPCNKTHPSPSHADWALEYEKVTEMDLLSNPIYWAYLPITIAWGTFLIQVGDSNKFIDYNWLWFLFRHISPYFWAAMGVVLSVGMSILGASW